MMAKVIALDLDGTLLHSDKTISKRTLSAVNECVRCGINPVIATARPPRMVEKLLPIDFPSCPWICYNGAEVCEGNRLLSKNYLSPALAADVVQRIQQFTPDLTISVESGGRLFSNHSLPFEVPSIAGDLLAVCGNGAAKILFDANSVTDVGSLLASLPMGCRTIVDSRATLGEIMAESASKVSGLQVLLDEWGLSWNDVAAFGDEVHDLEIVSAAGLGVAMANAIPELKEIANHVTKSNDEDGVAEVLEGILARWI